MGSAISTPTYAAKTTNVTNAASMSLATILDATPAIVFRPDFNRGDSVAGKAMNHCVLFKDFSLVTHSTTLADHLIVKIKAGTIVRIGEYLATFSADTAVSWLDSTGAAVTATAGKDYAIYVKADGATYMKDVTNGAFPAQRESTSGKLAQLLGGFHVGHVPHTAAVASGAVAFSSTNNVDPDGAGALAASQGLAWTNTNESNKAPINPIKMVNAYSMWDMSFMPKNREPRGMVFNGSKWIGIYMVNVKAGTSGDNSYKRLSRYDASIKLASGEAGAIPVDIVTGAAYPDFNWWSASDIVLKLGGQLMDEQLFSSVAAGVLEATALGGASVTPVMSDVVDNRFTSYLGLHGASGCLWTWGQDSMLRSTTGAAGWKDNALTAYRGQQYMIWDDELARVLLGGGRDGGSGCGSRCAVWSNAPRVSTWYVGARAACDHL